MYSLEQIAKHKGVPNGLEKLDLTDFEFIPFEACAERGLGSGELPCLGTPVEVGYIEATDTYYITSKEDNLFVYYRKNKNIVSLNTFSDEKSKPFATKFINLPQKIKEKTNNKIKERGNKMGKDKDLNKDIKDEFEDGFGDGFGDEGFGDEGFGDEGFGDEEIEGNKGDDSEIGSIDVFGDENVDGGNEGSESGSGSSSNKSGKGTTKTGEQLYKGLNISKEDIARTKQIIEFSQPLYEAASESRFLGTLPAKDSFVKFDTDYEFKKPDGKESGIVWKNGTPEKIKKMEKLPKALKIKYAESTMRINASATKPTRPKIMVMSIPENCLVDQKDILGLTAPIVLDSSKSGLVTKVLNKSEAFSIIQKICGSSMKVSEKTYGGEEDYVRAITELSAMKDSDQLKAKNSITLESKRPLVQPGTYLPIEVNECIDGTKAKTEEEIKKLNISAFERFWKTTKEKQYDDNGEVIKTAEHKEQTKETTNRKDKFEADCSDLVSKDEEGNIISVFFTTDASKKQNLSIPAWWLPKSEKVYMDEILIPIKKLKDKQPTDGSTAYENIKYSLVELAKNKDISETYKNKTSLYNGRFKDFVDAVGADNLSVEVLAPLIVKVPTNKSGLKAEQAMAIQVAQDAGADLELQDAAGADSIFGDSVF